MDSAQQDKAGAKSCIKCPEGKYCAGTGNTAPTGNCAPGYVCYKGSTSREPQDDTTGAICPKGMFCEEGATHPTPCAPGTYTNATGQHTCLPCPEGFYCDKAGEDPKKCPEKKVCAEGSARPGLCPLGSIPNTEADAVDVCVPCPQGKYCRGAVVAGDCLPGYVFV
ncbi:hypothetical protein, conserved [Eimeria necatrix]|uniref:Uncharacterized protein n=1 Tax=Eimeria necatrix TaxID=51315 RepID=U6MVT8_9EIME|nr:hypothetical protein, conserved [Eimeria necatrix]CDJ66594.1 hypothetical protein, conserved [Eimeria necatrix]